MAEVHAVRDVDSPNGGNGANRDNVSHTFVTVKQDPHESRVPKIFRRHKKCWLIGVVPLVVFVILIVILSLTVFKAKDPTFTADSVVLVNFVADPLPPPRANMTLRVTATVHNPNIASFKYGNSTANIYYRGTLVGYAPIPASEMKAHSSKTNSINVTMELDRFISDPTVLFPDIVAGAFPISFNSTLSGKVNIGNIVKKHITASADCNTTVYTNFTEGALDCHYHTKL